MTTNSRSAVHVKPKRRSRPVPLGALGPRASQIVSHVLNSVAFKNYAECCSLDDLAAQYNTTEGQLRTSLKKAIDTGLLVVEGKIYPTVYPTTKLLRQQDHTLSEQQAAKLVRRIRRA